MDDSSLSVPAVVLFYQSTFYKVTINLSVLTVRNALISFDLCFCQVISLGLFFFITVRNKENTGFF